MDYIIQLLSLLFETIGAEEPSPEVLQQLKSLEYTFRVVSILYAPNRRCDLHLRLLRHLH